MWTSNRRDEIWSRLDRPWDVLVIGGGITGAGILREATRLGARTLLVEQRDFAWGTSSRSSKLVHGGLRYLKEGQLALTRDAVRERERLLRDAAGLVEPVGFLLTSYAGERPGRWAYSAALALYSLLAGRRDHRFYGAHELAMLAPRLSPAGLKGAFGYGEAQTDDARLVLRLIREAAAAGGVALNYATATDLLCDGGRVAGVRLHDAVHDRTTEARATVTVNATGAWADHLRGRLGAPPRIRPLRGSHLIFPAWRLPVAQAISFMHPIDRRPVFVYPWEGITLAGTTDLDHEGPLDAEPRISPAEVAYLMAALEARFPALGLTLDDVLATYAGVRPVISSGKADPSREARDHVVWHEQGLLTVTGGKLTTFRSIALDALAAVGHDLAGLPAANPDMPALDAVDGTAIEWPDHGRLDAASRRRLLGRYGADTVALLAAARPGELAPIPGTAALWAELRWAARAEGVVHLDDLLLRRVRLGLLLPRGGEALLDEIRAICQPELGWDDARWEAEQAAYLALWQRCYSVPEPATIPDWRAMLAAAQAGRHSTRLLYRRKPVLVTGAAIGVAAALSYRARQHHHRRSRQSQPSSISH